MILDWIDKWEKTKKKKGSQIQYEVVKWKKMAFSIFQLFVPKQGLEKEQCQKEWNSYKLNPKHLLHYDEHSRERYKKLKILLKVYITKPNLNSIGMIKTVFG